MPARKIARLERRTDGAGRTLYFLVPSSDRRKPPAFLDPEDVPAFEGEAAWFELLQVRRGPWLKWRAVRQVDAPQAWPVTPS